MVSCPTVVFLFLRTLMLGFEWRDILKTGFYSYRLYIYLIGLILWRYTIRVRRMQLITNYNRYKLQSNALRHNSVVSQLFHCDVSHLHIWHYITPGQLYLLTMRLRLLRHYWTIVFVDDACKIVKAKQVQCLNKVLRYIGFTNFYCIDLFHVKCLQGKLGLYWKIIVQAKQAHQIIFRSWMKLMKLLQWSLL